MEGKCAATAAYAATTTTATIANAANTGRQPSRHLSSKQVSPCLPDGKQSKTGFQKSNQNGISINRLLCYTAAHWLKPQSLEAMFKFMDLRLCQ